MEFEFFNQEIINILKRLQRCKNLYHKSLATTMLHYLYSHDSKFLIHIHKMKARSFPYFPHFFPPKKTHKLFFWTPICILSTLRLYPNWWFFSDKTTYENWWQIEKMLTRPKTTQKRCYIHTTWKLLFVIVGRLSTRNI